MTPRRVLAVLGSPRRNGNSSLLAREAARAIEAAGGTCELVTLHGLRVEPCRACDSCQKPVGSGCVVKDDMQEIYGLAKVADALLLASPIYWFTVCAQLKLFLDRCYALHVPGGHVFAGKKIGLILTYGDEDALASGVMNAVRTIQDACRYLRADFTGVVHGTAGSAGEVASNRPFLDRAYRLGGELVR